MHILQMPCFHFPGLCSDHHHAESAEDCGPAPGAAPQQIWPHRARDQHHLSQDLQEDGRQWIESSPKVSGQFLFL